MKHKYSLTTAILSILILSITSCRVNDPVLDDSFKDSYAISLSGTIDQNNQTRANDSGFAENDKIGLYVVNYSDGTTPGTLYEKNNQATNTGFTFDGNSTWTPDYDIYYKDKSTHVDFYGYYPYASSISDVNGYSFEVAEDQSVGEVHGQMAAYEASDFLWAKTENVTPTSNKVMLSFKHKMSSAKVVLVEGEGFGTGEWDNLSKAVIISNTKRTSTIDLSTGTVTASGAYPARGTVPFENNDGSFRAIVVPQSVNANTELVSITIGGVSYSYSESSAFEYLAGKMHVFNITVDKKEQATGYNFKTTISISDWENDGASHNFTSKQYVIINLEQNGDKGDLLKALESKEIDAKNVKHIKLTGYVDNNDISSMRNNLPLLSAINMSECDHPDDITFNFENKQTLTSFIFPHNIKILRGTFKGSGLIGTIIIPDGVTEIGNSLFQDTRITSVNFPTSLVSIGSAAFCNCEYLSSELILPNSLETIGDDAFKWCRKMTGTWNMPSNLKSIGKNSFRGLKLNGTMVIPSGINSIPEYCFTGCYFSNVVFHDGIKIIGNSAFEGAKINGELNLPTQLEEIGEYAFYNCGITGTLVLPKTIRKAGRNAFADNTRLSGTVIFPDTWTYIPQSFLYGCSNIEGIDLPAELSIIETGAFAGCYYITNINCKAMEPPTLGDGVFNGIGKDNVTVEVVNEKAVSDYTSANGWNEFKRISVNRDFSISRRTIKTLNAASETVLRLRAKSTASWTASVPDDVNWITIEPSSGVGSADITISVNDLESGASNRNSTVTFTMDGVENCTAFTNVFQYNYVVTDTDLSLSNQMIGDGDVITVQSHTEGTGIPLVFIGDCYDAEDIFSGSYLADTKEAINYFFDIEPYNTYRNYFDVYIIMGVSSDSGLGTVNTIREAKFGTQYSLTGGALESNYSTAFEYAKKAPTISDENISKTLITVILNSTDYGGITYLWEDGSAISICPKSQDAYPYDFGGLVQHEAGGHGFGKLCDEYIYFNAFINTCDCNEPHLIEFRGSKALGWYDNMAEESSFTSVPWKHLFNIEKYKDVVDIYEGGFFHSRGLFRSEPNSCMNNNIPYYSTISRESIVRRIKKYAGSEFVFDDFVTNDVTTIHNTKRPITKSGNNNDNYMYWKHHAPIIIKSDNK